MSHGAGCDGPTTRWVLDSTEGESVAGILSRYYTGAARRVDALRAARQAHAPAHTPKCPYPGRRPHRCCPARWCSRCAPSLPCLASPPHSPASRSGTTRSARGSRRHVAVNRRLPARNSRSSTGSRSAPRPSRRQPSMARRRTSHCGTAGSSPWTSRRRACAGPLRFSYRGPRRRRRPGVRSAGRCGCGARRGRYAAMAAAGTVRPLGAAAVARRLVDCRGDERRRARHQRPRRPRRVDGPRGIARPRTASLDRRSRLPVARGRPGRGARSRRWHTHLGASTRRNPGSAARARRPRVRRVGRQVLLLPRCGEW